MLLKALRPLLCAIVLLGVAHAQTPVFTQSKQAVGINPRSITVGDVHSDGLDDVITGNHDGRTISVLINSNDGSSFLPATDFSTLNLRPDQVIAADFNADGLTDVALVSHDDTDLVVMYQKADGTFTTGTGVDWGGGVPNSIAVADFNGDGKLDIAVAVDNGPAGLPTTAVRLILNSGTTNPNTTFHDAIFNPPLTIITGPNRFWGLVKGDVNGDGKPDLAFLNCCTNDPGLPIVVEELINNGDNTFTPRPMDEGTALSVKLRDLDGNGRDDIVEPFGPLACTGCSTRQGITWIFNENDGTFTKSGTTFTGTQYLTGAVAFGDFNGAGGPGLALTATGSVSGSSGADEVLVYTPTGTRSFNPPHVVSVGTGTGINDIAALRISGAPKGADDLVVSLGTSNELDIFKNNTPQNSFCAGPASPGVNVCLPANGSSVDSPVQILAGANGGTKPITAMIAYVDGKQVASAGGPNMNAFVSVAAGTHRLNVNAWNSAGTVFTSAGTFTVRGTTTPPPQGGCSAPSTSPAINICQPVANQTVSSPVSFLAQARWDGKTISHMRVYVDNVARCDGSSSSITCQVALPAGTHSVTVNTWNTTGAVITKHESFIVH